MRKDINNDLPPLRRGQVRSHLGPETRAEVRALVRRERRLARKAARKAARE